LLCFIKELNSGWFDSQPKQLDANKGVQNTKSSFKM